ncbi:MAG: DUF4111 domain-containing protein [Anaerolineales bacterium]
MYKKFTPHDDVNLILKKVLKETKKVLGKEFIGMYLFGSLANGGFDTSSDIDILVVTEKEISKNTFSELQNMHLEISKQDSPWAFQLEVSYIPKTALRKYDPADNQHPHLDRGRNEQLHIQLHATDWIIQRYVLVNRGILIAGPDIKTLIEPVMRYELPKAVADVLPLWAAPVLEDSTQIMKRGYQSFFVLSLCRMLYTLHHCEVVSKQSATEWALAHLDSRWSNLIERALIGRQIPATEAIPEDIAETLEFIKYTLEETKPTAFPEVNQVLRPLLKHVKEILNDQFIGMYLYGSLSSGDFNPESSDIDFLVITKEKLSKKIITQLEEMHNQTWATSLTRAGKLEGAYIPKELIRKHTSIGFPCPTINEGKFYLDTPGSDWVIQRHVVREYGVILDGPDPKTLIDFVSSEDIRNSVMGVLHEWWYPMLENPEWLRVHDDGYRSFAIITMCRVFHALEHGSITSKPKAVQWARKKIDKKWHTLVDKAVAVSNHKDQPIGLKETIDFIKYTKEQIESIKPILTS